MGDVNLQNVVVHKPWGYEYLIYQNSVLAIWYLHIKEEAATSLHCHPTKKTGLILLSGEAVVSFMNETMPLKSISKLMIRPGLFHSTKAVSLGGISVLELETPPDKANLVRFEDKYGREDQSYEGPESMTPLPESYVRFRGPEEGRAHEYRLGDAVVSLQKIAKVSEIAEMPAETIIAVIEGGLVSNAGDPIVTPGDVGSYASLIRLAAAFQAPNGISLMTIRKEAAA
jgi:mannose-6-phosphate isomerase-like protein (cupin superfamily)